MKENRFMKLITAALALMMFGSTMAAAPVVQRKENVEATRINLKIRRLQLIDQLLPVLMTPAQLKAILPAVEKARQQEVDLEARELKELKLIEADLDKELKAAIEKGVLPSDEMDAKITKMDSVFRLGRQVLVGGNVNAILAALKANLSEGQLKAAANSLNPLILNPNADPATMSQDDKLKAWIQLVLLDRAVYDLLVDMSLKKG
jgi:hypothetical protein